MKWLGLGPGRCGTQTLAHIFGAQHEAARLPWSPTARSIDQVRRMSGSHVGFPFMGHAMQFRAQYPDLPIVCLLRESSEVVASHMRITAGHDRMTTAGREFWDLREGPLDRCAAYPRYPDLTDPAEAWRRWHHTCTAIMLALAVAPGPTLSVMTHELNNPIKVAEIGRFIGVQPRTLQATNIDCNRRAQ